MHTSIYGLKILAFVKPGLDIVMRLRHWWGNKAALNFPRVFAKTKSDNFRALLYAFALEVAASPGGRGARL